MEKIPEDPRTILAWNNLVFKMERPEVFFTHQWALAVNRAFSDSFRPLTFLIYQSDWLCGVAALATNREAPAQAFFLTASTADYCDVVSEPQHRAIVLAAVFEHMGRLGLRDLVLANVPSESHTLRAIKAVAKSQGFHLHDRLAYECSFISLGDEEQRRTVVRSFTRKHGRARLKKLGQLGPFRVAHLTNEQLPAALPSMIAAQISRFLSANRLNPLIRPERRLFLVELASLLSSVGWLNVSQLEVNGLPIAWNYGFQFCDSWFWYLPTFDIQYKQFSPGSCLLQLLAREACADSSVRRLDLGLGDEVYKRRFSNAISKTRYLRLSKSMPRHLAGMCRYLLAASAGRFPAVDKRLRGGREMFRRLWS